VFRSGPDVALTGKPGEGRTRTLLALVTHQRELAQRVEGFVALAARRERKLQGADGFRLHLLATNEQLPWARRDANFSPPYGFDQKTLD
jgi:nucleoside-triphosphatase THEP1